MSRQSIQEEIREEYRKFVTRRWFFKQCGVGLGAIALGDLLVAGITQTFAGAETGGHAASVTSGRFLLYAGVTFIVAILFSIVATFYRYRDAAAAEGK